jgi:hypothetical protein
MDINRNQFFLAGLVVLFLGLQFRAIESIVLNPKCTRMLAQYSGQKTPAAANASPAVGSMAVRPPDWVGWSLLSVGSVFILHSLAMKKPGS